MGDMTTLRSSLLFILASTAACTASSDLSDTNESAVTGTLDESLAQRALAMSLTCTTRAAISYVLRTSPFILTPARALANGPTPSALWLTLLVKDEGPATRRAAQPVTQ